MSTQSQSTVGSAMYVVDMTASPPAVLLIPQMKGISGVGGGKRTKIDISNMDSQGYNENAGGRADPPEATGEMVLSKKIAGHVKVKKLFEAQALGSVANIPCYVADGDGTAPPTLVSGVLIPPKSGSPGTWTRSGTLGVGYISQFAPKKADNDVDRCDFAFQYSGGATWNVKGDATTVTS